MFLGGVTFLIGSVVNGAARNVFLPILGGVLLGRDRDAEKRLCCSGLLTSMFELARQRVNLGLAAVPAAIGVLILPDTPNSLIERGYEEEAKAMLRKIRGTDDIQAEYDDLVAAIEEAKSVEIPRSDILQRKYGHQLTMTIGFGGDASLVSAPISGLVNVSATFISIATVDKLGRRALFLQDGTQMLVSQVMVGTLIALKFGTSSVAAELTKSYASILVFFMSIYVAAFAWSWRLLRWLVV
ncbi:hypothetical protein OPV22_000835 [Ensete ventricosum]|uniref:Major facilitator superfamily (MFS) profile domain-containing protein n=1 Tax=Ensete ventricosum TaxID=4639 RepID=A0AAV8RR39_ENSVE|nr:hypothetical protein OPV22_000835 [Ensete ventricosum]